MLAKELVELANADYAAGVALCKTWGVRLEAPRTAEGYDGGYIRLHRAGELEIRFAVNSTTYGTVYYDEWLRPDQGFSADSRGYDANTLDNFIQLQNWLEKVALHYAGADFKAKRDGSISRLKRLIEAIA